MEACVPYNTSACQDIGGKSGSSRDPRHPTQFESTELSMNEIKTCLTEVLNIDISARGIDECPGENNIIDVEREDEHQGSDNSKSCYSVSGKCLCKSATFPPPCEPKTTVDGFLSGKEKQENNITAEVSVANGSSDSVITCHERSASLPTPLRLVSAMKGSREKRGIPPRKLSVVWAPDVYDPVPTSVSHVPSSKNHQRSRSDGKRSGKNKQKRGSKSSRGTTRDKEKKQPRKSSGGSYKLKPLIDDTSEVFGFSEPQVSGTLDFNARSVGVVY